MTLILHRVRAQGSSQIQIPGQGVEGGGITLRRVTDQLVFEVRVLGEVGAYVGCGSRHEDFATIGAQLSQGSVALKDWDIVSPDTLILRRPGACKRGAPRPLRLSPMPSAEPSSTTICALSIAGLDPCGGAGLLADARAMRAFSVHACCVATALTAQNTRGVERIEPVPLAMLRAQLEVLLEDVPVRAVKIGMLPGVEAAQVLANVLGQLEVPVIYDTVFAPSGGSAFLDEEAARAVVQVLGPLCELLTPNLHEAQILCGFEISSMEAVQHAARVISERFGVAQVLVKGGHAQALSTATCSDWLWNGHELREFRAPRLEVPEARGTGCLLASAIAAQRAKGLELSPSVERAKGWLGAQMQRAVPIGSGRRVVVDV